MLSTHFFIVLYERHCYSYRNESKNQVGDNLLIANGTTDATTKPADSEFKVALIQNVGGLIEPVSSVDGVSFFYNATDNVTSTGDAIAETYTAYNAADTTAFNTNYTTTGAVGYVDYAFFLRAINTDTTAAKDVKITNVDLTYGGAAQTQKAFRVAVFVNDMGETGATAATAPTTTSLFSILRVSGATYFSDSEQAVASTSALGDVNAKKNTALTIGSCPAGKTNYYKVVVRLWLEGEDSTCNNTTFT